MTKGFLQKSSSKIDQLQFEGGLRGMQRNLTIQDCRKYFCAQPTVKRCASDLRFFRLGVTSYELPTFNPPLCAQENTLIHPLTHSFIPTTTPRFSRVRGGGT